MQIVLEIPDEYTERIRAAYIESVYSPMGDQSSAPDVSTDELLLEEFKKICYLRINKFVKNNEYKKAKREAIQNIVIEDLTL